MHVVHFKRISSYDLKSANLEGVVSVVSRHAVKRRFADQTFLDVLPLGVDRNWRIHCLQQRLEVVLQLFNFSSFFVPHLRQAKRHISTTLFRDASRRSVRYKKKILITLQNGAQDKADLFRPVMNVLIKNFFTVSPFDDSQKSFVVLEVILGLTISRSRV